MLNGPVRGAGLVAVVLLLLLAACGGRTNLTGTRTKTSPASTSAKTQNRVVGPSATAVHVIKGWSDALRHGDIETAAAFFAVPSQMINAASSGQGALIRIQSRRDAVLANESLPCGATFISAAMRGRFVDALFRLSGRSGPGGSTCAGGKGATARTYFIITAGQIVDWIRAPDEPGDNPVPESAPAPNAPAPESPPAPDSAPAPEGPIA